MSFQFSSIPDAVEAIRRGEVVIVLDDEDRENEGDYICAAELATPETINLILSGRGDFCMPILPEAAKRLEVGPLVEKKHLEPLHRFPDSTGSRFGTNRHHGRRASDLRKGHRQPGKSPRRISTPRTRSSVIGKGRRCATTSRPHRSRRGFGAHGWFGSCRCVV